MQVYKKILVTTDCSAVDAAILKHVSALARQNQAIVYLLHVVHSHTLDQDRVLREQAQSCLDSYRAALQAEGVETHILIRSGEPDTEILDRDCRGGLRPGRHGHPRPFLHRRLPLRQRLPQSQAQDQHPPAAAQIGVKASRRLSS